jgi:hypothetical protein
MKNWKTTLAGLVLGVASSLATGFANGQYEFNAKSIMAFIVPVVIGMLAKDFNVTGIGSNATTDTEKDGTIATIK